MLKKQAKVTTRRRMQPSEQIQQSEFVKFFKKVRKSYGDSHRDFATRIGISHSMVTQIENGYHEMSVEACKAIYKHLRVTERDQLLSIMMGVTKKQLEASLKE